MDSQKDNAVPWLSLNAPGAQVIFTMSSTNDDSYEALKMAGEMIAHETLCASTPLAACGWHSAQRTAWHVLEALVTCQQ